MSTPLVVVGAGGFGRETLDVVEAINGALPEPTFELVGVVDANPSAENIARLTARGTSYLGTDSAWLAGGNRAQYLIGVGSPKARRRVDDAFRAAGLIAAVAIHPSAIIGSMAKIGAGSVICGGVQVSTNVTLGRHVHLNPNATVGHDSVLNDFVSINPAATISGEVVVGTGTLVGAGAVVLQGLSLGEGALIGASACVIRNVVDYAVVKGVPAA